MTTQIPGDGQCGGRPHFVLIPLMAQGHMIPMVDMARLLAGRGMLVTVVTTPVNAARIQPIIDRLDRAGLPVRFVPLCFPCAEVGLPEGCENIDMLPSSELARNFFEAAAMLRDQLIQYLRDHGPSPCCVVSDVCHPWARDVAQEFSIPRLAFHGFGSFALLCFYNMHHHKIRDKIKDENEPFHMPGLPHRIEVTKAQVPEPFSSPGMAKFREALVKAANSADGVVLNTFDDLEPSCRELYSKALGQKVWTIGPLSLCSKDLADMAARGNKASIDENHCLKWLDSMKPSSVIYVSFGSIAQTSPMQLIEIGSGLEASNHPFIWVIKAPGHRMAEVEKWLSEEKFEERTRGRGLLIRGWAPQVMILSHSAVGGFMTHCGWNSTLESVTAGVPMITWPHFAEQFLNEKLVVEVLKIGFAVGVKSPVDWAAEEDKVRVKRDDIEKAVLKLMDEGEEGEERRKRAKELGVKALKAMQDGGSSYMNMTQVIQGVCAGSQAAEKRVG